MHPSAARAYGSYEALVTDLEVETVYVASPHSHHFTHTRLALMANKHVPVKKAFPVNAAQPQVLVNLARERWLFLLEALWTRFFPLTRHVQHLVRESAIGTVQWIVADRNLGRNVEDLYGTEHRLVNPALARGALLDLAVYPLTWVFLFLSPDRPWASVALRVSGSVIKYEGMGVDETVLVVLTSPETKMEGVATDSLRVTTDSRDLDVRIFETKGKIEVLGPAARPDRIKVTVCGSTIEASTVPFPILVGHGLFWEADECAHCLRAKKRESTIMPWADTSLMMNVFDQVREQNEMRYPEEIESVV
ncbi:Gfo/Idh/MocA family protein [Aspergillus homomorphus CBS 101889]|uniref:D-xylose 1-dehydrogenase (NADP(+), D-xylono-1,5-lactone-forming) n=1 Tax=Aspergillus homomorphus (strain CBS 101889) TaxID=1450537 RepID=A0A395I427_ASPHC|nr:dimeric dihydrodiol dehydrogenase [Aspergillus homomorphus CBS 101889]RAL13938.1 dimeric dihydrodiol dehydrogenase [Aspergillus homomorphus CBS 101889]